MPPPGFPSTSANTRAAYVTDLAHLFVWCSQQAIEVFGLERSGSPRSPASTTTPSSSTSSTGTHVANPSAHGQRGRAQGASALSRDEFERLIAAAHSHSPTTYAVVILLGLYGLRASEACTLTIDQIAWNHGQPVLRIAGKGRAANETVEFPLPRPCTTPLEQPPRIAPQARC